MAQPATLLAKVSMISREVSQCSSTNMIPTATTSTTPITSTPIVVHHRHTRANDALAKFALKRAFERALTPIGILFKMTNCKTIDKENWEKETPRKDK